MERLIFDEEHEMFRDSVRRFFQKEVEPHRDAWYEAGQVDPAVYRKAGEQGLLCLWTDEAYGGSGVNDFRFDQIIIEENMHYGDTGFFIGLHNRLVAPYLAALGTDEQKERFMPGCVSGERILGIAMTEPGAGSDVAGMKTRCEDKGDHWLLNGAKTYISNGKIGNLYVVAARTGSDHSHQLGLFLVEAEREGFQRGRNLKKMGLQSQDTAELFFDNVKLPKHNVLGDPSRGFYYLMQFLAEERLTGACGYVAACQAAFDLTMDYITERKIFGKTVADFQVNRFKMADMRMQIDVAQTFVDQCVLKHNAGALSADDAARAKLFTSEVEAMVMDECVQLHGGAGYMDEYRISRLYRDARVSRIYAGSSEVMREIIARSIGLDPRQKAAGKELPKAASA
ncbi:MAG: acyl-CoA dehydrogenase family protein [Pseudomonadota bacterium]